MTTPATAGLSGDVGSWWQTAVVYEVYVRSFADSNGDGEGDLAGVRARLPYLADLGVDALWLTPFNPSPLADGGYDVADYCGVDPRFGTLEDFDRLVADAHRHGLRLIVDIVPNHTSIEHPWFRAALADGAGSPAEDRYLVRPGRGTSGELPPNNWESEFGGPAWSPLPGEHDGPARWYLHLFAAEQPDLNWSNEGVRRDFDDILTWWLSRGVDGFRIDVAHGLVKADGLPDNAQRSAPISSPRYQPAGHQWHQPEVHRIYRGWRSLLDSRPAGAAAILIGEVWAPDTDDLMSYLGPDELQQVFTFDLLESGWHAEEFRSVVSEATAAAARVGQLPTWVLSNHDRVREVTRYGGGARGTARARAAALLMLSLPGSVYLYQGEELGLPEAVVADRDKQDPMYAHSGGQSPGRDGCRVPIPWTPTPPAYGFSDAAQTWLPMPAEWAQLDVATQLADPDSVLQLYRAALADRRRGAAVADAPFAWFDTDPDVLAFTVGKRLSVTNFGATPWRAPAGAELVLRSDPRPGATPAGDTRTVGPTAAAWFDLAGHR